MFLASNSKQFKLLNVANLLVCSCVPFFVGCCISLKLKEHKPFLSWPIARFVLGACHIHCTTCGKQSIAKGACNYGKFI